MISPSSSRRRQRAVFWLVVAVGSIAAVTAAGNAREVVRLLGRTDWLRVLPALGLTAVSQAALSAGLVATGATVGVRAPWWPMMRIALVSIAVNQLVSFGGVAGYSLRAALSKRHGVATGDMLAMSLVHSYLNNLAMFLLLAAGLLVLVRDPATDAGWERALQAGGLLIAVFFAVSTGAMFSARLRRLLVRAAATLAAHVLPARWSEMVEAPLAELDAALGRASSTLRYRPVALLWPCLFLLVDWAALLAVFWYCLDAVTSPVGLGVLVGGVSVGVVAGFASFLPGGIGVQEGSMAAVFAVQGVPLEAAVLATLLFRVVYYVVPFVATLPLYAWILRQGRGPGPVPG